MPVRASFFTVQQSTEGTTAIVKFGLEGLGEGFTDLEVYVPDTAGNSLETIFLKGLAQLENDLRAAASELQHIAASRTT
jgi:hypothetical protein